MTSVLFYKYLDLFLYHGALLPSDYFTQTTFLDITSGTISMIKCKAFSPPPSLTFATHNVVDLGYAFFLDTSFSFDFQECAFSLLSLSLFLKLISVSPHPQISAFWNRFFFNDMGKFISKPQFCNWKKEIKISTYLLLWKLNNYLKHSA